MANSHRGNQVSETRQAKHQVAHGKPAALKALYGTTATQHDQPQQLCRKRSGSSSATPRHHPVDFPLDATWLCNSCNAVHTFTHITPRRPLGIMKCPDCNACAGPGTRISGIDYKPATATRFIVSIPAAESGPPQTNILWSCCACGRSHIKHWRSLRQGPNHMPQVDDSEALGTLKHRVRERWRQLVRSVARADVEVTEPPYEPLPERPVFSTALDRRCRCAHAKCEMCLAILIPGVDEFIAHGGAEVEVATSRAVSIEEEHPVTNEALFSMIGLPGVTRPYRPSEGRNSGMVWVQEDDDSHKDRWIGYLAS